MANQHILLKMAHAGEALWCPRTWPFSDRPLLLMQASAAILSFPESCSLCRAIAGGEVAREDLTEALYTWYIT